MHEPIDPIDFLRCEIAELEELIEHAPACLMLEVKSLEVRLVRARAELAELEEIRAAGGGAGI